MPKLVRAVGEFIDKKEKLTRDKGEEWICPNQRADNLARLGLVAILVHKPVRGVHPVGRTSTKE